MDGPERRPEGSAGRGAPTLALRIHELASLTGVKAATLRAWERRYGFPTPLRELNNYRRYSREDAEAILRVTRLIAQGYGVREAIEAVSSQPPASLPPEQRLAERFWSAVMVLNEAALDATLDEAQALMPPASFADGWLLPLFRKRSCHLDRPREALLCAVITRRLRGMMEQVEVPPHAPLAVVAGAPREARDEELWALALQCALGGWRVKVVPPGATAVEFGRIVAEVRPHLAAVSFVRSCPRAEFHEQLLELVDATASSLTVTGPGALEHYADLVTLGVRYAGSVSDLGRHAQAR